jgi:hypothetical protein
MLFWVKGLGNSQVLLDQSNVQKNFIEEQFNNAAKWGG